MERKVSCLWKEPAAAGAYKTGVSLHSHTNLSHESLSFIAKFLERNAFLNQWFDGQKRRASRIKSAHVDLYNSYWTPPLSPLAAYRLETKQIEQELNLASLVSITDHDTIGAPTALRVMPETSHVPVSVEWTVPLGEAVFHMGIHNLAADTAEQTMQHFKDYTANPRRERLTELLSWLHAQRNVLIVLNHPFWDLAHLGAERHRDALCTFLLEEGERIHALELSGIRSWEENQSVRQLAETYNQMVVSGGDRHGTEPNATLNLSNAQTFEEFVNEIRRERRSHTLFMPQYTDCNTLRVLETILSAVRDYPENPPGSQRWDERTFHPNRRGEVQPLSAQWLKPPAYITAFFAVLRLLDVDPVRNALTLALRQPQQRFAAQFNGREEVAQ